MNLLICTVFDIDVPCAGLNRIGRMSKGLQGFGVTCITVVGAGSQRITRGHWERISQDKQQYILYDKQDFSRFGHCNAMRIAKTSAAFYRAHLAEVIQSEKISGVLVYSPQHQLMAPILEVCRQVGIFVLADCGENFSPSLKFLLNGVYLQQRRFISTQLRQLDGALINSPEWEQHTRPVKLKTCLAPGFIEETEVRRVAPATNMGAPFKITLMGKFCGRELPITLILALMKCHRLRLDFVVQLIGTGRGGALERFWIWILRMVLPSEKLIVFGYLANEERNRILASSDLFVMLRRPNKETAYIYPSRVSEYLVSGNPVILTQTASLKDFFKVRHGVFFISDRNDPNEISSLIIRLNARRGLCFKSGLRGTRYALENFGSFEVCGRIATFLSKL